MLLLGFRGMVLSSDFLERTSRAIKPLAPFIGLAGLYWILDQSALAGFERGQQTRLMNEQLMEIKGRRKMIENQIKNSFVQVPDFTHLPVDFDNPTFPIEIDLKKDIAFVQQPPFIHYCRGGKYLYNYYRQYPNWHEYVRLSHFPSMKELLPFPRTFGGHPLTP